MPRAAKPLALLPRSGAAVVARTIVAALAGVDAMSCRKGREHERAEGHDGLEAEQPAVRTPDFNFAQRMSQSHSTISSLLANKCF